MKILRFLVVLIAVASTVSAWLPNLLPPRHRNPGSRAEALGAVDPEISDAEISSDEDAFLLSPLLSLDSLRNISTTVSYFYLHDELGLSEEAMWKITYEAGSVLEMKANTIRRKVDLLRETMDLSDSDVISIIERQPTILQLSADKNIAPTMLFLLRTLELGRDDLRQLIVREPSIICYKTRTLYSKINFFSQVMGYSTPQCREILLSEPKLLRSNARSGLISRFRFLLRDVGISIEKLRLIVQKHPRILLYSLNDNLIPKLIFFFVMTLQMESKQIERLLTSYPSILDYNLDRHVLPIAHYFLKDLGFQTSEFRSILLKFPRLVTHSLRKIKHVVGYFRYELGFQADEVKRVLFQAPQTVGLNTEGSLKGKIDFLRSSLGLDEQELRKVLAGTPTILCLSIDKNLSPKLDYLKSQFSSVTSLKQAILRLPTLLGYSLENRIRPRMELILESGLLSPDYITIAIPMKQEVFSKWLGRRIDKAKSQQTDQTAPSIGAAPDPSKRITHWTRETGQ